MKRIKIFISSVQSEFAEERAMLCHYIRTDALLGKFFEPFIFEEVPANEYPTSHVYLKEVELCDIYLGLYGNLYGYEDAEGISPTEREYDLAAELHKSRLIYIKSIDESNRHPKETAFIRKVERDIVRKTFVDMDGLRTSVYASLIRYLEEKEYIRWRPFDASYDNGATIDDLDEDLSEAEAYYTKLAYDTNDRLIRCGGEYTWKSALQEFGVDTTGYKKPAKFVFLPSDYDFDVWKFWSYLCAYLYTEPEDEEAAEETDEPSEDAGMEMWEFDDQAKQAIELLFKHQYEFTHSYSGSGRWVLNETYTVSDYMHYQASNKVNDAAGQIYGLFVFDFKPTGLEAFCEDRGDGTYWIVYSLENLEIRNLNEKDAEGHYTATGWYFKNQLAGLSDSKGNNFPAFYTIGSGLYSTSVSEGYGFFLKSNGKDYWFPRSAAQSAADIAPDDALFYEYQSQAWFQTSLQNMTAGTSNPNTTDWGRSIFYQNVLSNAQGFGYNGHGYCQYFQMYQWDSQSSLSYGIKQKYTFDQAIENILTGMSDDLYSYYLILSGGTQTANGTSIQLYGGHQSISSPVGQNVTALAEGDYFLHDYGYDMRAWGTMHCGIAMTHQQHNGVDIVQNAGSPVYAMFGGEITALEDGLIVISATEKEYQVHLWLNQADTIEARANYSYVQSLDELSEGDIVTEGQLIGYTTSQKQCITDGGALNFNTIWSANGGSDYLHITLELKKGWLDPWTFVDPRLLIRR